MHVIHKGLYLLIWNFSVLKITRGGSPLGHTASAGNMTNWYEHKRGPSLWLLPVYGIVSLGRSGWRPPFILPLTAEDPPFQGRFSTLMIESLLTFYQFWIIQLYFNQFYSLVRLCAFLMYISWCFSILLILRATSSPFVGRKAFNRSTDWQIHLAIKKVWGNESLTAAKIVKLVMYTSQAKTKT